MSAQKLHTDANSDARTSMEATTAPAHRDTL